MKAEEFLRTVVHEAPGEGLAVPLKALWWEAKGDWTHAHALVDELETPEGMAVHAYLHRKEGAEANADYWYARAGRSYFRADFDQEWCALVEGLGV